MSLYRTVGDVEFIYYPTWVRSKSLDTEVISLPCLTIGTTKKRLYRPFACFKLCWKSYSKLFASPPCLKDDLFELFYFHEDNFICHLNLFMGNALFFFFTIQNEFIFVSDFQDCWSFEVIFGYILGFGIKPDSCYSSFCNNVFLQWIAE